MGWRIEFRPLDIQITDFENAALCLIIIILSRMILSLHLNFKIPISKVDENIRRSNEMDAILTQKFWFRKHYVPANCELQTSSGRFAGAECECEPVELTIREIFEGTEEVQGLFELMNNYLINIVKCSEQNLKDMGRYLEFFRRRISG